MQIFFFKGWDVVYRACSLLRSLWLRDSSFTFSPDTSGPGVHAVLHTFSEVNCRLACIISTKQHYLRATIIIGFLFLFLGACTKDPRLNEEREAILGTWKWVAYDLVSEGGISHIEDIQEPAFFNFDMTFDRDGKVEIQTLSRRVKGFYKVLSSTYLPIREILSIEIQSKAFEKISNSGKREIIVRIYAPDSMVVNKGLEIFEVYSNSNRVSESNVLLVRE